MFVAALALFGIAIPRGSDIAVYVQSAPGPLVQVMRSDVDDGARDSSSVIFVALLERKQSLIRRGP
jgi:hypothetical protein